MFNKVNVNKLLKVAQKNDESIMYSYFGTANKNFYIYPQVELPDGYDPTGRDWYKKATENKGKVIWTKQYKDSVTGDMIISTAKAVINNEEVVGVIGFDISLKDLSEKISKIKIGNTGIYL